MSQSLNETGLNETPASQQAVSVRDATAAALEAAVASPPAEHDPQVEQLAAQLDIADPGSILRFGQEAQSRARHRSENRSKQSERFFEHHRGQ